MSVFSRFNTRLQHAIVARLGWSSLRTVQELAGEALLEGRNAVVLAPTAGGKTEAAVFPLLSELLDDQSRGVGALYVAPIKALLNNQAERLGVYTEMVGLRRFVWHGDTTSSARQRFLKDPAELLMTTPESLEVMLVSARVDVTQLFPDLRMVVIDEVHGLAGSDRGAHLMSVLERIANVSNRDIQRVGLSATVGNPQAILNWLGGTSKRDGVVVDPPRERARRQLLVVHRPELPSLAKDAARMAKGKKSLFFCESRSLAEAVAENMRWKGTTVFVHHSAVSKSEREAAEARFYEGSDACIVCTSTLELGIDVGDLDQVFQAEAPDTVSSFLQRMGRTGRREGHASNTTFFCQTAEGVLQAIALIELAKGGWVEDTPVNDRCWPVFLHQLFAMALASDSISPDDAWEHLSRLPDFCGIHHGEFERLLTWMLRDQSLFQTAGRLVLGPKAERRFGRRNFMDLYAVFSSPQSYVVLTAAGQALGTLSQGFVDRLTEGESTFLLAGRAWQVIGIFHTERQVRVDPAPSGRRPTWGGYIPQFLGFELCQMIRAILRTEPGYAYLHQSAAETLRDQRTELSEALNSDNAARLQVDGDEIRWWTFAGGRINSTLRYALGALGPSWNVIPDNYLIRIRGEHLRVTDVQTALETLKDIEFWEDERLWKTVSQRLPNYRLSKFQPFMPPWVEREVLAEYLLDVEGAWAWVSRRSDAPLLNRVAKILAQALRTVGEDDVLPTPAVPAGPSIEPSMPTRWVMTAGDMASVCRKLAAEPFIALDVETTFRTRSLCLVQLAGAGFIALIDVLEVSDLSAFEELMGNSQVAKIIHNASFEKSVLRKFGIQIENIIDTLKVSRQLRGKVEGGHSLKSVCARELGIELDKGEQLSNWARRPLTKKQLAYAALDVEVLLRLHEHFAKIGTHDAN